MHETTRESIRQIMYAESMEPDQLRNGDADSERPGARCPDLDDESSGLDGNQEDPVVICGFSLNFSQDATSPEAFWNMMMERRCAMTEFPPERLNAHGFHQKERSLNAVGRSSFCAGIPVMIRGEFILNENSESTLADTSSRRAFS